MESYNNRPMKIAKVVATLPSNYTCDKFIYLLVQWLNLHPHLTVNSGSALHCNSRRESKGWTLLKENPLLINTSAINYATKPASSKQQERTSQYLHVQIKHQCGKRQMMKESERETKLIFTGIQVKEI